MTHSEEGKEGRIGGLNWGSPQDNLDRMGEYLSKPTAHTDSWRERLKENFNWKEIFGKNSSAQREIESFIAQELKLERKRVLEEATERLIEAAEPYQSSKWLNNLSKEQIKKILQDLN